MGRWRAVAVAAVLAVSGCTSGQQQSPAEPPQTPAPPAPSTLAAYDTDSLAVARAPFCDRVSPTGVEHAIGAVPESSDEYGNGDRFRLPDGSRSISHEYGCSWSAPDGTTARAWVFAPPVTRARAGGLVAEALTPRCVRTGTGDFGTPSVAVRCRAGDSVEISWRGLFGDAWLVCSLATDGPVADLPARTEAWCVSVLDAARL
jgi:hypothetical protein